MRGVIVDDIIEPPVCGRMLCDRLRKELRECSKDDLLDALLAGIQKRELKDWGIDDRFASIHANRFDYVLTPLPNLFFMRDNAAWIGDGVLLSVLATPARTREARYLRGIYKYHPLFKGDDFKVWYGNQPDDVYPASIEGGDVLVLDERTVLIGCGDRTTPAAAENVSLRLFERSSVDQVIVVPSGATRRHAPGTVLTMVDVDKFNFFPGVAQVEVFILRPARGGDVAVTRSASLEAALRKCLGRDDLSLIASGPDEIGYVREQWDDGHNTLAIAPGTVVSYRRNQETNQRLRDAGVEVLELDASELWGRGGSHDAQPLLRDPVGEAADPRGRKPWRSTCADDACSRFLEYTPDGSTGSPRRREGVAGCGGSRSRASIALIFEKPSTRTLRHGCVDGLTPAYLGRETSGWASGGIRTWRACSAACSTVSSTAASNTRRSRSWRAGRASRCGTASPTVTTPRRCWRTSSPCVRASAPT